MNALSPRQYLLTGFAAVSATVLIGINLLYAQEPKGLPVKGWVNDDANHENKLQELLNQYAATEKEDERTRLAESLDKLVAEEFEVRQKVRAAELKELEDQLAQLRKLHDKRASQKEVIVRERTRQLLRDADGLGWNYETPSRHKHNFDVPMGPNAMPTGPARLPTIGYPGGLQKK